MDSKQSNQNPFGNDIVFKSERPRFVNNKNKPAGAQATETKNYVAANTSVQNAGPTTLNGSLNTGAKPFVAVGGPNGSAQQAPEQRRKIPTSEGRNLEDDDEDDIAGLLQDEEKKAVLPSYVPPDGEFHQFPEICRRTVENLQAKGYQSLFPIQQHCFYPVYQRQDLVARDLTGSGKTFAFGLPTVEYLRKMKYLGTRRVQAIVLAPTRELAIQVTNEMAKLKHYENEFKIVTVYGGVNIEDQIRQLKQGVDIFVGTTGRVLDHISRGNIDFSGLKTIVLDEADQMLKLGFKEDVDKILKNVQDVCDQKALQMCLFSATIPSWVKSIARSYMKRGFMVVDLAVDLKNKTAKQVQHLAIECPYQNRMSALADTLIVYGNNAKTIVFTQTKQDANSLILSDKIKQDVEVMHGDIAQNQREVTLKRFKEGKFKVLVATDVASRGIDIKDVDLVIQIEPPKDTETYIHRSGRTARAGKSGTCITFYTKKTYEFVQRIEEQAGIKLKRIGVPQAEQVIKASSRGILNNLTDVNEDVLHLFEDLAKDLIEQHDGNAERALMVALAYCSGHYKHQLVSKSLLNGQENQTTIRMSVQRGRLTSGNCYYNLKKYWDPRVSEQIRNMKQFKDCSGCVFDIKSEQFDSFMDNFGRLKETEQSRIDFDCTKCTDLPDLEDEGGYSQNWRESNQNGGGYGGRGGYNNRQGGNDRGYGGGGGYQSSRGGGGYRERGGYQDNRRGGGGYESRGDGGSWGNKQGGNSYGGGRDYQQDDGGYGNSYGGNQGGVESSSWSRGPVGRGGYGGQDFRPRTAQGPSGNAPLVGDRNKARGSGSSTYVYVSNLKFQLNEQDILDFFKSKGLDAIRARLLYDDEGNSKGTAFVEMNSLEKAEDAVAKLDNVQYQGRKLIVNIANKNSSH